jgi:hypothetical protein
MKAKYISVLVGLGAAATFAAPGVASASTAAHVTPATHSDWCTSRYIPSWERGREIWVLTGRGMDVRCDLLPIHGHGGGGQGGNHGGQGGNHGGQGGNHGGQGGNHGGQGGNHGGQGGNHGGQGGNHGGAGGM